MVETHDVQRWLDAILETSTTPLSAATVRHAKFVLSGIFRYAIQQGYRNGTNPVEAASVSPLAARPTPSHAYSLEELSQMLDLFEEPARTIVGVCAFTGMRIGEVEGLQWEDWRDGCLYRKTGRSSAQRPELHSRWEMSLLMQTSRSGTTPKWCEKTCG